jgi:hypothetical protein
MFRARNEIDNKTTFIFHLIVFQCKFYVLFRSVIKETIDEMILKMKQLMK